MHKAKSLTRHSFFGIFLKLRKYNEVYLFRLHGALHLKFWDDNWKDWVIPKRFINSKSYCFQNIDIIDSIFWKRYWFCSLWSLSKIKRSCRHSNFHVWKQKWGASNYGKDSSKWFAWFISFNSQPRITGEKIQYNKKLGPESSIINGV